MPRVITLQQLSEQVSTLIDTSPNPSPCLPVKVIMSAEVPFTHHGVIYHEVTRVKTAECSLVHTDDGNTVHVHSIKIHAELNLPQ
ncbi:MAG: hypothetical protein ACRC9T_08500 [Vibrionaceae bacterium]